MENSLLLEKFVTIFYGNRRFYLPRVPANIYFHSDHLEIYLENMESYVIVDGIRCYYYVNYEVEKDMIHTHLKDFELDGLPVKDVYPLSFPVTAEEFPFSKRDARIVVPRRDYSEVTKAFLAENRNINERLVKFLEKHPDVFDKVDISMWEKLNKHDISDMDADILDDYLSKPVANLFRKEMLS